MRALLSFFVGLTGLFAGCSTTSVNQSPNILTMLPAMEEVAPGKDLESVDIYLRKRLAENPSDAMEWWTRYNQGKLWAQEDPKRSCEHFKALGETTAFPLHNIATLRALEVCPSDDLSLPPLEQILERTAEPWLQEIVFRTVHARAATTGESGLEMKLAGDVSVFAKLQSEKIQLLTRAIELAEKLQQNEFKADFVSRLEKTAPRFRVKPKPSEYLEVALDFRKARMFDEARAYYRKAIASQTSSELDRYKALDGIRLTNKLEVRDERYVKSTHDLADFARAKFRRNRSNRTWAQKFHDSQLQLARTLWTETTVAEALKAVDRLEKEIAGYHSLDEAYWLRARIEEEAGRHANAVKILGRATGADPTRRSMTEKIQWYRAWNLRKLGKHKEAAEELQQLTKRFGSTTNGPRNRFWMAKSLQALGREDEAKGEFEALISDDPLGYYGILSYRELGRELPPALAAEREPAVGPAPMNAGLHSRAPMPEKSSPFVNPYDHAYVEWLISLGELPIARRYLGHYMATHRPPVNDSPKGRELLKYLARAGSYQTLFTKLGSFNPAIRSRILAEEPTLLFPQPFAHYVSEAGRKFGVAPELMYAIMRQESLFDPLARSHADAFGLMQLIPEAAKRVEGTSGIKLETPEELYRPDVNVTLGAAFLRNLMDQYDEQFVLTVASYNASEKAIRGWMKTRFKGDALEFIEDIPYEETRGYVKLVLRNYIFYLRLNSGGRPIPFPEWCLDTLHDFKS